MPTISLCMIVKNEEKNLRACIACVREIADEIVIVDTGSTDRTKEIAAALPARLYDFTWADDFSAARNFAFSKCTCDYIYSADADERMDAANLAKFRILKEALDPRIEIVQMYYGGQLKSQTVYNYDRELRPKLFRRLRTFQWEDPIHEQVRLTPVVYDSDIEIQHCPEGDHAARDLAAFRRTMAGGYPLSDRLFSMYARELIMAGTEEDFLLAETYFQQEADGDGEMQRGTDEVKEACCIAARAARIRERKGDRGSGESFLKYAMKCVAAEGCSEICCELGAWYLDHGDPREAELWYYNAAHETQPLLDLRAGGKIAEQGLEACRQADGQL